MCKPHTLTRRATLLVLLLSVTLVCCQGETSQMIALSGKTMGTTYSIKIVSPQSLDVEGLQRDIDLLLIDINNEMSTYVKKSTLSLFNQQQSTDWVTISPALTRVVTTAKNLFQATGGAYDITVGPLVNLWGFGPDQRPRTIPHPSDISRLRSQTGSDKLIIDQTTTRMRKTVAALYVDLSSIAKGYAVDRVSELLLQRDLNRHMVEIGGELKAVGSKPHNQPWQIALEKPSVSHRKISTVLPLRDYGLATSGTYRNYFEENGQRYSHTIDPITGAPIQHSLVSVSVLAKECMVADAWATALMVLGRQRGQAIAEQHGIAAYFVEKEAESFSITTTRHWQELQAAKGE